MSPDDRTEVELPATLHIGADDAASQETQQVEQAPETPAERPRSARDVAMEAIARRRQEAIEKELSYGETLADDARAASGQPPLQKPAQAATEQPEEPQPTAPHQAKQPAPEPVPEGPQLQDIEIDGQRFQVTKEQFDELARNGVRAQVAVANYQRQVAQQPQQPPQQQPQQPPPQVAAQPLVSKELAEQYAERLQYGGKDQIAATLQEYAQQIAAPLVQQFRASQQQVPWQQVMQLATAQAVQHMQLQLDLRTIETEFPDIAAKAELGEFAAVQLGHVRQQDTALGRRRAPIDQYREACNRVMSVTNLGRGQGQGVPPQQQSTSQAAPTARPPSAPTVQSARSEAVFERKRGAPSQPSAVDRRASAPEGPREKSGAEIVRDMMKARGQLPLN